jgi:hypothetical protein
LCRVTLARIDEPVILIDWSDLKADQSLHLLRASLPVGGRSTKKCIRRRSSATAPCSTASCNAWGNCCRGR